MHTLTKLDKAAMAELREEMKIRRTSEVFILFALGSQYDGLIKARINELGMFCIVADPSKIGAREIQEIAPIGIILSGGPVAVYKNPPPLDTAIFDLGIPVLGICLGFQMWAKHIGATVRAGTKREYGRHLLTISDPSSPLFLGIGGSPRVVQSHGDVIEANGRIEILGGTSNAPVAAGRIGHLWGVQFHPEVRHTEGGMQLLENFCAEICGARDRFPARSASQEKIERIRNIVGDRKVLLALSGGSDSSVVAYLLRRALPKEQVHAVYIKGVDRPDDAAHVEQYFASSNWISVKIVDATDRFLAELREKSGAHEKRIAMRKVYRLILEEEIIACGAEFIAQGTLYTDISESGGGHASGAEKAQIKIHHNVNLGFSCGEITPLDDCFKDTARNIGRTIGVPEPLLVRHPFPGPGLLVRVEGEVTPEKLEIARAVDRIWISALRTAGHYEHIWQAGATVTQSQTTCTKGDGAAQGWVVALWAVDSIDGFTATFVRFDWSFLEEVSRRITNEVPGVGTIVYRISDKPPATIEWG